jgi:hypothetical protein
MDRFLCFRDTKQTVFYNNRENFASFQRKTEQALILNPIKRCQVKKPEDSATGRNFAYGLRTDYKASPWKDGPRRSGQTGLQNFRIAVLWIVRGSLQTMWEGD